VSRRGVFLLVLAAVSAAHLTALGAGYVQDDHVLIESNPLVARGDPWEILSSAYWERVHPVADQALWRPVPILSYALERRLAGGPAPRLAHAGNVALHACVCALLLALALRHRASLPAAALGALAFGLHPAKSEAVYNVVGRAEILAAGFGLLALLLAAAARGTPTARRRAAAWGGGAALFLALGSKETAVVFLPLLLLQDALLAREGPAVSLLHRLGALLPALVSALGFVAARTLALEAWFAGQTIPPLDNVLAAAPAAERVPAALSLLARYAARVAAPWNLSLDYSGRSLSVASSWAAPAAWAGVAVLLLLTGATWAGWRATGRRAPWGPLLSLGSATAWLPLLVVGNLVFPVGALFAERFLYLPLVGFGAMAAAAGTALPRAVAPRRVAAGVAAAILVAWGWGSWTRGRAWRDDATAFEAALRAVPGSPRAAYALGKLRADAIADPAADGAATASALGMFDRALAAWDDYPEAWKEKGLLLARAGRLVEAEAALREAVRRGPQSVGARFNLAVALQRLGRLDEAARAFRHALLQDPEHAPSWASLGHLAFARGRWKAAAEAYARAVALGRTDLAAREEEARRRAGRNGEDP
jgi:tetratricopeptide (TPR) repeat protein